MPKELIGNRGNKPYSPGTRSGNLVFVSGQLPLDGNGKLVPGGAEAETRQVIENIKAILAEAGATLADVTMAHVYLTDRDSDFETMNKVFREYFGDSPPARATIEVSALGQGARVEIAAIAAL
jgi:2-iminobutanoate/2-iminopropanoate deaminase